MTENLNMAAEKAAHKMWVTKGCRFNAHTRLSKQAVLSTAAISLISFYIAAASILSLIPSLLPQIDTTTLNLTCCIASILVIIFSILENGAEYAKHAVEMYRCASEINCQYDILRSEQITRAITRESLEKTIKNYHEIIAKYPINHTSADLARMKMDNLAEFGLEGWKGFAKIAILKVQSEKPFIIYYLAMLAPILFSFIKITSK